MLTSHALLRALSQANAVLTNQHFVFTSGNHGPAYVNMRAVAHDAVLMGKIGGELAEELDRVDFNGVIGPETLGRSLAQPFASKAQVTRMLPVVAIWCDIVGEGRERRAVFSPKLDFGRLVEGRRFVVVDDLLTTGSSLRLTSMLITDHGGEVVAGAAAVRRTPDIDAATCGVPRLEVLADISGFKVLSPEECATNGPCSDRTPMVLRPGHGQEWIKRPENAGYPTA